MINLSTVDLLAQHQEQRAKELQEAASRFPKNPPRNDAVPAMFAKLAEIDKVWVEFLISHDELVNRPELDGSHPYFANDHLGEITKSIVTIANLANKHTTTLNGFDPAYDLVNRPDQFHRLTMLNNDGTKKGTTNSDPSIIASRVSMGGSSQNSSHQSNPPNERDEQEFLNQGLNDFFNPPRQQSVHSNLLPAIASVEAMLSTMLIMDTDDPTFATNGNILLNRMKNASAIHDRLILAPGYYDSAPFFELEAKIVPITSKLSSSSTSNDNNSAQAGFKPNFKTPAINMPTFNGDYTKWWSFKNLFKEIVEKKNYSPIEKLIYLKQSLKEETGDAIKEMDLTEDSYEIAWTMLKKRYENPRQLAKARINKLFNIAKPKTDCLKTLKKNYDILQEVTQSIRKMGTTEVVLGMMLHQVALNILDSTTYTLFEQSLGNNTTPQTEESVLMDFMLKRFQSLELPKAIQQTSNTNQPQQPSKPQHPKWNRTTALTATIKPASATSNKTTKLCECKDNHQAVKCPKFIALSVKERYNKVKAAGRCVVCLGLNHQTKDCKAQKCRECSKAHHTMLHFPPRATSLLTASKLTNAQHVFLGTVMLKIQTSNGEVIPARALLDSGSQVNVMTDQLLKKTGLKTQDTSLEVVGMGQVAAKATKRTVVNLSSFHSSYKTSIEVFVLKHLTSIQPSNKVDITSWNIPEDLPLADEKFNIPAAVDLVIGGEWFFQLLANGYQQIGNNLPDLQNTVFGWIVVGKLMGLQPTKVFAGMGLAQDTTLKETLSKFWKVEECSSEGEFRNDNELAVEKFYEETTTRDSTGRYTVKLQFTSDPDSEMGHSVLTATRRFFALERKLIKNPEMQQQYVDFMREYEQLGHMEQLRSIPQGPGHYFIPHHAVLNPSSSTTKFRVVFDASAKTTTNTSLNELMANGPILQDDLFTIMARFRMLQYVFSADITKMYRQIRIAKDDQRWQLILWRENPAQPLKCYRLLTVTYGTKCASYLAIKTLQHIATTNQHRFPLAAVIAKRDFNVDDIMSGSNNLNEALSMQQQLSVMLKGAQMELHKWCANHPALLRTIPANKREVSLEIQGEKEETKALGMKWIPKDDIFMLKYEPKHHDILTKRTVLSEIAQLFDPLGLVGPVIVRAKKFIQELWQLDYDWDTPLPKPFNELWIQYRKELQALTGISVMRHAVIDDAVTTQVHIFSDASEIAYGTVMYVRSINKKGDIAVRLLCSKSRVAPLNKLSVPRLELCGAVLSIDLKKKLSKKLGTTIDEIFYWTDSEIVLSWMETQSPLKTFVANRVSKLKRHSTPTDWRYVETKHNPADLISRGCSTFELAATSLWWNGPFFLRYPETEWPTTKPEFQRIEEEEKTQKKVLLATTIQENVVGSVNHRNSIVTWQRILAHCIKFGTKSSSIPEGHLTNEQLRRSMVQIIKYAQYGAFHDDIQHLRNGKPEKTQFKTMTPIFDADGVLRVGGRLQSTNLSFEQKHPAIEIL